MWERGAADTTLALPTTTCQVPAEVIVPATPYPGVSVAAWRLEFTDTGSAHVGECFACGSPVAPVNQCKSSNTNHVRA